METAASSLTAAVIADEIGNVALDGGAQLEILFELGGLGIGASFVQRRAMVTDEDLAHVLYSDFVVTAGLNQRTIDALFGGEAEAAAFTALGTVSGVGDDAIGTDKRLAIGQQGEVIGVETLTLLSAVGQRRHQLGLTVGGLVDIGMTLAGACGLVVDELVRGQAVMLLLSGEQVGNGDGIGLAAGVGRLSRMKV